MTPHLFKLCSQTKEKGKETDLDVGVGFSNETNKFWIEISHKHCTMIRIRRGAAMIPLAGNKYLQKHLKFPYIFLKSMIFLIYEQNWKYELFLEIFERKINLEKIIIKKKEKEIINKK